MRNRHNRVTGAQNAYRNRRQQRRSFRSADSLVRAFVGSELGLADNAVRVPLGAVAFVSLLSLLLFISPATAAEPATNPEVRSASVDASIDSERAKFAIQAEFKGPGEGRDKAIYGAVVQHAIHASVEKLEHAFSVKVDSIQGGLKEIVFSLSGEGEIKQVSGTGMEDWSVRQAGAGNRFLVVRLQKSEKLVNTFSGQITAETISPEPAKVVSALTLTLEHPTLANGYVRIDADAGLDVQMSNPSGVVPIEARFLPEGFRAAATNSPSPLLAFRFLGTSYELPLAVSAADPEARKVVLTEFNLVGRLADESAAFTLSANARVKNPKGASIELLSGGVALTEITPQPDWRLKFENGRFIATFAKAGEFPIRLKFNAAIRPTNGWNQIDFGVAPSALQPVVFQGLKPDTQFRFRGAARPERSGDDFSSFLPPSGRVRLAWQEKRPEAEGALFFAAEELSQISVSPGLMRQTALFDFKVMQGELNRVTLLVRGDGEVTRVQGPQVLSWIMEPIPGSPERRLTVQFNQAQKDQFAVQVQTQTALGAFPQAANAVQLRPEGATRFGGHFRIVNEGAVRLEVLQAGGLSQISPEQFPQTDATKALPAQQATQVFAYRFSGGLFDLRIQADNILPEVAVSEVLAFHLAETELTIDAEIELDVREAPLRELLLRVPKGYAVARLNVSGLSDYFLTDTADQPDAQLRVVYGNPVLGRQLVQLRLERNSALGATTWTLPRIEVVRAKSVRGHVGVSADAGFRLTPSSTQGLTEIGIAFFPKKIPGIQTAFRLSDPGWQAGVNVERLPQSVQADAFHLFSVGEGIAYGSSIVNYLISGAPISAFRVALTNEYFNVEFTGKDVRNWQKVDGGYVVQLHTPVAGAYTLLATYERPFKAQGETLRFIGAQPLDAQSEQGHTIVVSTYQFQVQPVNVSTGLAPLEPGEVPAEYRLFFDAPILAAYRYSARPFNLQLDLKPLVQGETINQVVDRASLTTRISKEGQVVTDARYFVKNKGAPNLRLTLPDGSQLWSVTLNGSAVVPVTAGRANLIPLPQKADPNSVNDLQIKIASRAKDAEQLTVAAPIVSAPVLLSEWKVQPEAGRRVVYRRGSLTPDDGAVDVSGFAGLKRLWRTEPHGQTWLALGAALGLLVITALVLRLATSEGTHRFSARHLSGGVLGIIGFGAAAVILVQLADTATSANTTLSAELRFLVPIQQADSSLTIEVSNVPFEASFWSRAWALWPALAAVALWFYALVSLQNGSRKIAGQFAWVLVFWAALRMSNGAPALYLVLLALLVIKFAIPSLRRWWEVPGKPEASSTAGGVTATTALLLFGALCVHQDMAQAQSNFLEAPGAVKQTNLAESVIQQIRVQEDFVFGTAQIRWQAIEGQTLPLLHAPGVLTKIGFPPAAARLVQVTTGMRTDHALIAEQSGVVDVELHYQLAVTAREGERGFAVPVQHGLVNRLALTLTGLDADLNAPQSVSVLRQENAAATDASFALVLAPVDDAWIGWKPRSRDTRREKAVFYAETFQLYVPGAGIVEGLHQAQIRPAQGELTEMMMDVPAGLTITDVVAPSVSLWRFDPGARKLRVGLNPAQAKPFSILIKSQTPTGPLPFEQSIGLLSLNNAAGQVGVIGIATGAEVQLDEARGDAFSPINIEDFPGTVLDPLRGQVAGLTLRRAYRYSNPNGVITLKASPVEPDVRVESQQTISLGEDRTVLAANLNVAITRAGIFKLSFHLPSGFDVDSISGPAMSHWTELKSETNRLITLHLKSRTEGAQQFALGLTGSGIRSTQNWSVPKLVLREAGKQRGQLLVVPEQGLRLQVAARDGVTQLDPLQSGVRQKGVLAFRLLQTDWKLALDLERVDAWTQVTSMQHVVLSEAMIRVTGNLQYEIENAGVKALRVRLPASAENVRFRGDQVNDFIQQVVQTNAAVRDWEIKLNRRVSGKFLLQANYRQPLSERATNAVVMGIEAQEVNLQRGFVTLESGSRLQVQIDTPPAALQPAEWQSIPRALQQDLQAAAANYTFRLVEPAFQLPLRLDRHEAAKLLPARVNSVTLTSVVSDDGVILTQARLMMIPGDKQLLHLTLPDQARFWFAFVAQNSVWPWRERDQILIPLEQHSKTGEPVMVELFYTSRSVGTKRSVLDLSLLGPRFDLPLENISWRVFLNEKWQLKNWSGSLQLQDEGQPSQPVAVDLETYVKQEAGAQKEKTREAEQFLSVANSLLEKGDPEQARRAFQNAFGLSQHDNAFNEDARVQLHNLKTQQALVGLNVRQAKVAGEGGALVATPRGLREGQAANYTQQEAKKLMDRNSADENAVQMRLVERLIQQQEAVVANPSAIRATLPEHGRKLTFARSLQVETNTDLKISLSATEVREVTTGAELLLLAGIFVGVALVGWMPSLLQGLPKRENAVS
ncbi:MAG: hypothetical protein EXS31_07990 [Pedosphaera sp.]|nr:hypothetical protein [Pedosphaera sp.]